MRVAMRRSRIKCPKCRDWRVERRGAGTDFDEIHCLNCGLVVDVGLALKRRVMARHSGEDEVA